MAKVYKATIYLVDIENEIQDLENLEQTLENVLNRTLDMSIHVSETKESDGFEWDDDLRINLTDSTNNDFETYFSEEDSELEKVKDRLMEAECHLSNAHNLLDDIHGYDTDTYREISVFLHGEEDDE